MNVDRRAAGNICIALLREVQGTGEISEQSHVALVTAIRTIQNSEYWQIKNQERHEGKNSSTDTQLAIARVAHPALEAALKAVEDDDYAEVLHQLEIAVSTDGTKPKRRRSA